MIGSVFTIIIRIYDDLARTPFCGKGTPEEMYRNAQTIVQQHASRTLTVPELIRSTELIFAAWISAISC